MENENYIKMILALPDKFFKNWEFEDGDQFYLTEDYEYYPSSKNYKTYTIINGKLASNIYAPEEWRCVSLDLGRPIPRQEQLQDMVINKFNGIPEIQLLESFYSWVNTQRYVDKKFEFHSIKCSMLRYAVLMLLRKEWDGEKWVGK